MSDHVRNLLIFECAIEYTLNKGTADEKRYSVKFNLNFWYLVGAVIAYRVGVVTAEFINHFLLRL